MWHSTMRVFISFLLFAGVVLAASSCKKTSISHHRLSASFEPSDILWDPASERLWVVSDDGELASITYDGASITYWTFDSRPDLEGIVKIPGRDNFVYLLHEKQKLLEFNVLTGNITAEYKLRGTGHLEAVAWVSHHDILFAGGQAEGTVQVHKMDFETGNANFIEQFSLPAPNPGDLSALFYNVDPTAQREYLTALYDRHKLMVRYPTNNKRLSIIDKNRYDRLLGEVSNAEWVPRKQWQMPDIGSEGITWADIQGTSYFFVCIDTAKRTDPRVRAIHRYAANEMDDCFNASLL